MNDETQLSTDVEVVRRGRVSWLTHPPAGVARIEADSFAFHAMPVSLPDGDPLPNEATPGELLAITHAIFLAAAVSEALVLAGSPANEIVVEGACTFAGPVEARRVAAVDLHVLGRVPGLDLDRFRDTVAAARRTSLRAAGFREDVPGELEIEIAPSS
jgi:hypothetical protein